MPDLETPRPLTPEEQARVNRAQRILWAAMAFFILVPLLVAWLTGAFSSAQP